MISEHYAQKFCKDDITKIENYDKAIADTTHTWDLHHRLELTLDGEYAHSREELKRLGMYYHRPYFELIFLTKAEHRSLHHKGRKRAPLSEETRQKLSASMKGKNKGLTRSEENRQKISYKLKGRTFTEESRKKMSESAKARWTQIKLS